MFAASFVRNISRTKFTRSRCSVALRCKLCYHASVLPSASNKRNLFLSSSRSERRFASAQPTPFTPIKLTAQNFQEVISDPSPVLIDCYANWCEPCKVLTPLLEKHIAKHKGRIRLAMFDVDAEPELAQQIGISSLPTVIVVIASQAKERFTGLIPEAKLVQFLDTLVDTTAEADTEPAENSAEGMLAKANEALEVLRAGSSTKKSQLQDRAVQTVAEMYEKIITAFPNFRAQATSGLVQCCLLTSDGMAKATELVASIRADTSKVVQKALTEPSVARAFALVDFNQDVAAIGQTSIDDLKTTIKNEPTNIQALYDLAVLSFVAGNHEEAVTSACKALTKDRQWKEGAAKKLLQKMLAALGPDHALYPWARKRFANAVCL